MTQKSYICGRRKEQDKEIGWNVDSGKINFEGNFFLISFVIDWEREKLAEETQKNTNNPSFFIVPVEVDQENMTLNWTVESKSEV